MTFKTRTLTTGAVLALLAASTVWAQSTAPAAGAMPPSTTAPPAAAQAPAPKPMSAKEMDAAFTKADGNKDGKLDRIEAEKFAGLPARFDQADADGDKMVSKAELEKAMK
jgi:EF hand